MSFIIDSIDLDSRDGFDLRAEIVPDDTCDSEPDILWAYVDTRARNGDYDPATVAAWRNGDWRYVGIIVTASRGGIDLGSDSVWAVEYGDMPSVGNVDPLRDSGGSLDTYRADLIDNAVAEARMKLAELADAGIDGSAE